MAKRKNVSEQLRAIIASTDMTPHAICKVTGVDPATMSRFLAGASVGLCIVDRLAGFFDLELTAHGPKKLTIFCV